MSHVATPQRYVAARGSEVSWRTQTRHVRAQSVLFFSRRFV